MYLLIFILNICSLQACFGVLHYKLAFYLTLGHLTSNKAKTNFVFFVFVRENYKHKEDTNMDWNIISMNISFEDYKTCITLK